MPPEPGVDPTLLERLADEFLERRRRGEGATAAEYADRHPELAEQIAAFFPTVAAVDDLGMGSENLTGSLHGGASRASTSWGRTPERLGDFRIIREVGRGGMGVVYEAEQESLGRRVALKVLASPALLDPGKLARFHREARSAARLHHTNIVPVFGVGDSDGVHYYVMQFIPGQGLDEVLEDVRRLRGGEIGSRGRGEDGLDLTEGHRRPASNDSLARSLITGQASEAPLVMAEGSEAIVGPASGSGLSEGSGSLSALSSGGDPGRRYALGVARIGVQVADALGYAHEQGVLHRDIKPSNVMLDAHGIAWVTDFGLAKAAADDDLTHTGDIVGTVRYMAPERFHGQCDARSDLYAVGLTLYELLARRPAFDGGARNVLIRQVTQLTPPRLRRLDPSVPKDLETIVHKAIEKDPGHRYATAGAMAADLRRFLEDRPIHARRVSPVERLVRWSRRNPGAAALGAAAFLLLALTAIVSSGLAWMVHRQAEELRQEAYRARQAANAEARARKDVEDANTDLHAAQGTLRRTLYAARMNLAQAAWDSNDFGRVKELLDQARPKPGRDDLRGWEWNYWQRLCRGSARTLEGHTNVVSAVAYRPDGATLASAGADATIRLWDPKTGKAGRVIEPGAGPLFDVSYSPDGAWLAAAGGVRDESGFVAIWDAKTWALVRKLEGHANEVHGLAFSPDGKLLATGCYDGTLRLFDATTGALLALLATYPRAVQRVTFSPDGTLLAIACSDGTAAIWDVATRAERHLLKRHVGPSSGVAFSPDGARLATSGLDKQVRVWNVATGALIREDPPAPAPLFDVRFSPDGTILASSGMDQTTRLSRASDGELLETLHGHTGEVREVAFSPDGAWIASASSDRTVKLWDRHAKPDGLTIPIDDPTRRIGRVAYAPEGRRIAACIDSPRQEGRVEIRDADDGRPIATLRGHSDVISGLAFRPDGRKIATASWDRTLRFWDPTTGAEIGRVVHPDRVRALAYSPDGRRVAIVGGARKGQARVRVIDDAHGVDVVTIVDPPVDPIGVAFRPDGKSIAVGSADGSVRLYDAHSGEPLMSLTGHTQPVGGLVFSPDGDSLATGGVDRTIKLWDVTTGREINSYKGQSQRVMNLAFSPDGKRLASASTSEVKLWAVDDGDELLTLKGQTHLAFSPDGLKILTAGDDHTVRIWDGSPLPGAETGAGGR